jgi:hypothetical protein
MAGAARVIMPQRLSTRPTMTDEAEFWSSVWIEMPCIVVAAPITAMHTTPMAKLSRLRGFAR